MADPVKTMIDQAVVMGAAAKAMLNATEDLPEGSEDPAAILGPVAAVLATVGSGAVTGHVAPPYAFLAYVMAQGLIDYKDMTTEEAGELFAEMVGGENRRALLISLATEAIDSFLERR